ncbi:MAG: ribose 5-phosphate isomerase B [candidate division Zixibacteria bacterium]
MKIALGADHKGLDFKDKVKSHLIGKGIEVTDFGTFSEESTDYPDYGIKAAEEVAGGKADYAVLVCWTGNGMAIAANKVKGIRAGLALTTEMAEFTRAHNNANVLVLSSKYTSSEVVEEIVEKFLATSFEGGRHQRRVDKIIKREDR